MSLRVLRSIRLSKSPWSLRYHKSGQNIFTSTMLHRCKSLGVRVYEGKEVDLIEVKDWLSKYEGGSVTLTKNESLGIADILLDHPNKRNAMSGSMMVQLGDIVEELENWKEGKGVILHGAGGILCSGGDLDFARASSGAEGGFKMACYMHEVLSRLKALHLVSAAIIHGQGALGGGAELATACDWRLMTNDCRGIGLVHTRMGIVPAWGASSRLASIVGSRTALELITSSRIVTPEESLKIGLVDAIVGPGPDGDGLAEAVQWVCSHIQADPEVIHAVKATMASFDFHLGFDKVLEEERRIFAPLWGGPANQKALNSRIKHLK
ncbi:hypothetical protein ONE63_004998 [Megalurothrips usitatus]|uniref:Ethylmalonyl-CoA decarboxylase n=1 Tax=Megalurothrips usitatus TaxID=439358 RepID=A0AAV7X5P8_9NEOP|nr:hypothetical protein ONE63_004998 [Megalurothrips usitatus]